MDLRRNMNRLHHKLGSSPLILFLLGGLVLVLWAAGTVVQIQTSEYLALGNNARVTGVAWSVLAQPYFLVTGQIGQLGMAYQTACMYGWVVEAITLVFALSLTVAVHKISASNPHLAKGFVFGGLILLVLNSWADYSSSPGTSPLVQALVALAVGGIVVVGLPLGIGLIEHALEEF
jgi:hypothetical protein